MCDRSCLRYIADSVSGISSPLTRLEDWSRADGVAARQAGRDLWRALEIGLVGEELEGGRPSLVVNDTQLGACPGRDRIVSGAI